MREQKQVPTIHFFVCANRRDETSPLGAGCAERGEEVYAALKKRVAEKGAYAAVWITKTHCLGICPKQGCTIAVYPEQTIVSEVSPGDALAMLEERCKRA
jgi:(2Fe-2S) ferredoxin